MARAGTKTGGKRTAPEQVPREHPLARSILHLSTVFGKVVEKLGIPAAVLVLLLATVYILGDKKTQNDFVRELLFGELNQRPILSVFIGLIVVMMLSGGVLRRKDKRMESAEMKRIAEEKSRLQAQLIGKDLSHTENKPLMEATPSQLPVNAQQGTNSLSANPQPEPLPTVITKQ